MYRAIKEIGGYKIGDEIPDSKAELWLEMFKVPHVEKVEKGSADKRKPEENEKKKNDSLDSLLEDYLGRNQSVVKKNVEEDRLSNHQLRELLKLEEKDKRRPLVIQTIKKRLRN